MSGKWAGSTRRDTLPPDWRKRRAQRRALAGGRCEWIKGNGRRCETECWDDGECDHWVDRNDHRLESLRWLCHKHHARKTQAEARAARSDRPSRQRPSEEHPATNPSGVDAALVLARRLDTLGGTSP
jgi:hypothetical protein